MDLLVLWGVTQAVGFVFKPILEELAKDAAKDYVKDFFQKLPLERFDFQKKNRCKLQLGKPLQNSSKFNKN
jgi:hypothetical protein